MTLTTLDLAVIVAYFGGLTAFGLLVRRISAFEDFSVAERAVPTSMVFASLSATYIGPGYSLGLAAKGATSGFFFLILFLFFSIQTVFVGMVLAPRLRTFKECHTLGDVMGALYGREAQVLTGLVSLGLCAGFAAVLARAGGAVLAEATGLGLASAVLIVTGVGVVYTFTGGLKSVIATEAVQFGIILLAVSVMVLMAASQVPSYDALQSMAIRLTGEQWTATAGLPLVGLIFSFLLGETLIPPYANRALAAESANASRRGFVLAGLFSVVWFSMMVVVGLLGKILVPEIRDIEGVFVALAAHVLPSGLLGLLLVAIAAIVMLTQESLLNAGAVALTRDLVRPLKLLSDSAQLRLARVTTAVLGTSSVFFALRAPTIIEGLLICYSIWAPTVLPALIWGLLGFSTARWSGVLSIVLGGVGSGYCLLAKVGDGDPAVAIVVGLISSFAGAILGRLIK